ncbi:hypothetical protein [Tychonema sp. LEGE 07203]|uniref:hypothetical protein n=1 Tax=Tychonema sp. LEGE 07203 TaxID=1828671 RepID=UPI001D14625D|nr:hypothetical protein [Tychonema sp. LEGE 07203]
MVIAEKGEEIKEMIFEADKQPRRSGDSPLKGIYKSRQIPADKSRQRTFTGELNIYYDEVMAYIRDAESILIFGPGEEKNKLKKSFEENDLSAGVVGIETVDKMTDSQIAAKNRQHFTK